MPSKKKKHSLPKPNRGFATTSIPKKLVTNEGKTFERGQSNSPAQALTPDDETYSPLKAEEIDPVQAELIEFSSKIKSLATKDFNRIQKAIQRDRRLASSLNEPSFIPDDLREKIISQYLKEPQKLSAFAQNDGSKDKDLIKIAIVIYLFESYGINRHRIEQCLKNCRSLDLEDAFYWFAINGTGVEARFGCEEENDESDQISSKQRFVPDVRNSDEILIEQIKNEVLVEKTETAPKLAKKSELHSKTMELIDSDDEFLDPNVKWARCCLEKYILRSRTEKKSKEGLLILELDKQLAELQSDVLFDSNDAHPKFEELKKKWDATELQRRLTFKEQEVERDPSSSVSDSESIQIFSQDVQQPDTADINSPLTQAAEDNKLNNEKDDDNGSIDTMFGDMFVEDVSYAPLQENTVTVVSDMTLPRGTSGKWPTAQLVEVLKRRDSTAKVKYDMQKGSLSFRCTAKIYWGNGKVDEYSMNDEAVVSSLQAQNYAATLALYAIVDAPIYKSFPPAFRDLWNRLENEKKADRDEEVIREIQSYAELYEQRGSNMEENQALEPKPTIGSPVTESIQKKSKHLFYRRPEFYRDQIETRKATQAYNDMLKTRSSLPIYNYQKRIIELINSSQVIILSGETGCGKSTQLPTYLLEYGLQKGNHTKILVTEPRRISAISLAQRVSHELGESSDACGTQKSLVGYSIRLESKVSRATRLIYATTGTALRMLEDSPLLDEFTHIIIDEVHERSIESDFFMLLLKPILEKRKDLKLVLMSATVDSDRISAYMNNCPVIQIPGRTFPVTTHFLEDAIEMTEYKLDSSSDSPYVSVTSKGNTSNENDDDNTPTVHGDLSAYSSFTKATLSVMDEKLINFELVEKLLEHICFRDQNLSSEYSAAILIFMPSLDTIRRMTDILESHSKFGTDAFRIYPLHSSISAENQSIVFKIPPYGIRKIVVATNIAETGITIPDITCVIDMGKHREMRYDEKRKFNRLTEGFVAKSNAAQRRGRAGRVKPGICFHMFTKARHDVQFIDNQIPEMLRLSLQDLVLRIKLMEFGSSVGFVFTQALDSPSPLSVQRAIEALKEVKALTSDEEITPLGKHLVKMPLDVHMAKFLIMASIFSCLDSALCIAAILNSKSPFLKPFGVEKEAEKAKNSFKVENNDFLTFYRVYKAWRNACSKGEHRPFCSMNYVSHSNFVMIEDLRQQYLNYLIDSGFVTVDKTERGALFHKAGVRFVRVPEQSNVHSDDKNIIMGCLAAAMYPKLLVVEKNGDLRTYSNNAPVSIHPSSVNFTPMKRSDFGKATFATYFNMMQSKNLYVFELGAVEEKAVLLLCGEIDYKISSHAISLDRKQKFLLTPRSMAALKILRKKLNNILSLKMKQPDRALTDEQLEWLELITETFSTEKDTSS